MRGSRINNYFAENSSYQGGVAGVGMVILIMVLAGFSGMVEILVRKLATAKNFKENRKIAFVPHILMGYVAVITYNFIW